MNTTIPQKRQKPYVYALSYPESMGGYIFYIGKGKGKRINQHERERKAGIGNNKQKEEIIQHIWDQGEKIVKTILAYFETDEEASFYEFALIFLLPNLTNIKEGTPRKETPEEQERRRRAREVTQQANKPRARKEPQANPKKPRARKEPQANPKKQTTRILSASDEERLRLARKVTRQLAKHNKQP